MDSDLQHFHVVACIHQRHLDTLKELLQRNKYRIFQLDGEQVTNKATFFAQAADQLPQEPGLIARHSWDALTDALWGGLATLNETRVAFLWTFTDQMLNGGLPDLLIAVSCFEHLASEVAITEHGFPQPMALRVFLLGHGANFPSFALGGQVNEDG